MNLLLLTAHSIAEYDDVRMFSDLGYDVFSIGAYSDPAHPGDDKRPALADVRYHADLVSYVNRQRERHAGVSEDWAIDWAKADLAPEIIEWADVIIAHHFLDRWIVPQWNRLRHKRVIWRTCGQSNPDLELLMAPLHDEGLQIVRYSPKERTHFERIRAFAGEDAVIRFGKYPADYPDWVGTDAFVGNVTQKMVERGASCGLAYWLEATDGLPAKPAGPGSEQLSGGIGELTYPAMLDYLARCRVYLYTGTVPASYTLGLMEAMLIGVPVVSISARSWNLFAWDLFEGSWMTYEHLENAAIYAPDGPALARESLIGYLDHPNQTTSNLLRGRARAMFDVKVVGDQWDDLLMPKVRPVGELVAAAYEARA